MRSRSDPPERQREHRSQRQHPENRGAGAGRPSLRRLSVTAESPVSASPNSAAVCQRSAGSFSSARATAALDVVRDRSSASARSGARLLRHDSRHDRLRGGPGERRLAGQHLVEHRAERVDVGPRVEIVLAGGLLGAHVLRRAETHAGLGEPDPAVAAAPASAMPKSATSARPSWNSTLSGLMSRWITPWRCA